MLIFSVWEVNQNNVCYLKEIYLQGIFLLLGLKTFVYLIIYVRES